MLRLDQSFGPQLDQHQTDSGPGCAKLLGEVALRRQTVTWAQFAISDPCTDSGLNPRSYLAHVLDCPHFSSGAHQDTGGSALRTGTVPLPSPDTRGEMISQRDECLVPHDA